MGSPSQSYGASSTVWDHTVLPATSHRWMHPHLNPSQRGWYLIYLSQRDGRLSYIPRWFTCLQAVNHPST